MYKNKKVLIYIVLSAIAILAAMYYLVNRDYEIMAVTKAGIILAILCVAALTDYKEKIIPNKLILAGLVLRLILYPVEWFAGDNERFFYTVKSEIFALILIAVFFGVACIIIRNGIGMGDIKLMMLSSIYLGFQGVFGALFMSLICIFFSALFLLITRKKNKKDVLPFAPAIMAGTFISIIVNGL